MSSQQQSSTFTSTSYSYSSSSSSSSGRNGNQEVTGHREMQTSYTDPSGTTVQHATQNIGEPVVAEERRYDAQGREFLTGSAGANGERRIEDVSDEDRQQAENDRRYEEAMEEEYAKREGGA